MKCHVKWSGGDQSFVFSSTPTESDFWKAVGSVLPKIIEIPNYMTVNSDFGIANFEIKKRGYFQKDGIDRPSMYVVPKVNDVRGLSPSQYEKAYLTCVLPPKHYKFYEFLPNPDGTIGAKYGSIGSDRNDRYGVRDLYDPFPSYMYWIRYYEKISKGYIDQSHIQYGVNYSVINYRASCFSHYCISYKICNLMSYTMSTGVEFGLSHPYFVYLVLCDAGYNP